MKKTCQTFFLLMLVTSGTSYAQSIPNNWFSAGQCMGLMIGAAKYHGIKPTQFPQSVIDTNKRYQAKFEGAYPKQIQCKNKSANVDEFTSCVNKIEPKSDLEYLLGQIDGQGFAKRNDVYMPKMVDTCLAVTIK